jgi:hypothetical protein
VNGEVNIEADGPRQQSKSRAGFVAYESFNKDAEKFTATATDAPQLRAGRALGR